jgi:hypothetical protein
MVALVERMLELHKLSTHTLQEKEMLTREIETTDAQIDKLMYELYGLTEESPNNRGREIRIVEDR